MGGDRRTADRHWLRSDRGSGSRVRFVKDGMIASFHRPHPAKEAKRYQVREAREYLIRLGVRP
jgi:hypothetical protein